MYQLLKHPTENTFVCTSVNSSSYPDFMQIGYTVEMEGTARDVKSKHEELMSELYGY